MKYIAALLALSTAALAQPACSSVVWVNPDPTHIACVTYLVKGAGIRGAGVNLTNETGGNENHHDISLPWTLQFPRARGAYVGFVAYADPIYKGGWIDATILVDGYSVQHAHGDSRVDLGTYVPAAR